LSAAEVAGWAALFEGYEVKKSEVHGMAQRGGSVESHLRFGEKVYSPLIPEGQAHYLVPFDLQEARRLRRFLKNKGIDFSQDLEETKRLLPDKRYVNVFLLGRLSQRLAIQEKSWRLALERVFASRRLKENMAVFSQGRGGIR